MGRKTKPLRDGEARAILDALGGEFRFRVMAAAWRLRPIDGGVLFNLPCDAWGSITLTAPDHYRIEIGHRERATLDGELDDVPRDKPAATFTAMTGITLTL
jgi:hypothetical protein